MFFIKTKNNKKMLYITVVAIVDGMMYVKFRILGQL